MKVSKFTKIFYIFSFFFEFILIYAVDKLFFLYRGLDLTGTAVLVAVASILMIILEVPSGAVADRWDRRKILIIAGLTRVVCMVVWIFSTNLTMFALGIAILVAGYALESGTLQAFVYDFLKIHGREDDFEKVWGRGSASHLVGIAVAMALGGFLSTYSYELTVGVSAAGPLIAAAVVLALPADMRNKDRENRKYFHILVNGVKKAFGTPVFLRIFLFSGIVLAGYRVMDEYTPVLMADRLGLSNTLIGIWLAVGIGIGSIGSIIAHRLREHNWKVLFAITIVFGLLSGWIVFTRSPVILAVLVIFYLFSVITWILIEGIIQRSIDSEERATITSVNSMVVQAGAAVIGLLFGVLADRYGIHIGYGLYGALFLLYSLASSVYLLRRRSRKR